MFPQCQFTPLDSSNWSWKSCGLLEPVICNCICEVWLWNWRTYIYRGKGELVLKLIWKDIPGWSNSLFIVFLMIHELLFRVNIPQRCAHHRVMSLQRWTPCGRKDPAIWSSMFTWWAESSLVPQPNLRAGEPDKTESSSGFLGKILRSGQKLSWLSVRSVCIVLVKFGGWHFERFSMGPGRLGTPSKI